MVAKRTGFRRITVDVPEEQYNLILELADQIHGTNSDVLRRGLALMKIAVEAENEGKQIGISDDGKSLTTRLLGIRS